MRLIPPGIRAGADALAIVGWDEGGAGHVQSWIGECGYRVACFVNAADEPPNIDIARERPKRAARQFDFPTKDSFKSLPLVTASDWPDVLKDLGVRQALVMTTQAETRLTHILAAREAGIALINAIHPTATILPDALLEDSIVLFPRTLVGYRAEVGSGVMINTGSQIDHHNVIGACATLDPGVTTAGNVVIGRFARVHTGATIINKIRIGEGAIVGAGAVIIRDVPAHRTVVGVPGRILDKNPASG